MEKTIQIPVAYADSIMDVSNLYRAAFFNEDMKNGYGWIANAMGYVQNDCIRAEKEQAATIQMPDCRARYLLDASKTVMDELGEENDAIAELRKYLCKQLNCII